jgi:hypothetical protein
MSDPGLNYARGDFMDEAETVAIILRDALMNLGCSLGTAQEITSNLTSHTQRDSDNEQTREVYGLLIEAESLIDKAGGILHRHGMFLTLKPGEGPYLMEHIEAIAMRGEASPEEEYES